MTTFNKELLDHLKSLSKDNPKVDQLIEEKKQKLEEIDKSRFSYQKNTPKPTPSRFPRIDKTYKSKTLSDEQVKEVKETVSTSYDKKIKQSIHDHFEERGYETELGEVKELGRDNLVLLHEKDSDVVLDKIKQQKLEKNEIKKEQKDILQDKKATLDITMDNEKSKEVFGDLETEKEITSLEEKEIKHNIEVEHSIHMDEEKSEKTFGRRSVLDDFKDNSKEIKVDRNKTPSPSDDFE